MFIGHYAPAFAAKAAVKSVPLWVLFAAAQWVDYVWAAFILLGVEKLRLVENFIGRSPMDLYYMPFSHGLPSSVLLSLLIGGVVALGFKGNRAAVVGVVALTAFSHWVFDLIVHAKDLPLWMDDLKVGLRLWAYPQISVPTEILLMLGGLWLYDRTHRSPRRSGTIALWLFGFAMAALQIWNTFLAAPPASAEGFAQLALAAYTLLTLLAAGTDYLRRATG